jgi:hypothetical protein
MNLSDCANNTINKIGEIYQITYGSIIQRLEARNPIVLNLNCEKSRNINTNRGAETCSPGSHSFTGYFILI